MNNTKQIIDNHKKRILHERQHRRHKKQNNNCTLKGNCLQSSVVYHGKTTTPLKHTLDSQKSHRIILPHQEQKLHELCKHIWVLKYDNTDQSISWCILSSSSHYNSSSKRCNLCLKEKFLIICRPNLSSLNKRNELVSSC